jgi:polar amino acid transport system substrate-binding protein
VELAKAAVDKLGVPLQLVEYPNSGEIAAAGSKDAWDISFMPADPERARLVDQGPAYVAYTSGYLVRAGSDIVRWRTLTALGYESAASRAPGRRALSQRN